ncbi:MAG: AraC family transcriptional regulator [Gammaproteobacteria bacterium]|nr:AraC family transcriptional regulator [Gammaproteobacteria bacterium]
MTTCALDSLASIFERFSLRAHVFNTGPLCQASRYSHEARCGHIHVLKQGAMRVETPTKSAEIIRAPYLLFYMKPVTHRLVPLTEEGDAITVCGEIDFGDGLENPVTQVMPGLIPIELDSNPHLSTILDLLFEEAFNLACGRQAALDRICELLVIQLLRISIEDDSSDFGLLAGLSDQRLAKALTCIHKEPEKAWTLEKLASEAGMSRASFAVKFRDTLGMTAGDYLAHWRLGVAKSLLKKGRPISLVADEVGYSSPAAFSRAFAGRFGQTPSIWLKQAWQMKPATAR